MQSSIQGSVIPTTLIIYKASVYNKPLCTFSRTYKLRVIPHSVHTVVHTRQVLFTMNEYILFKPSVIHHPVHTVVYTRTVFYPPLYILWYIQSAVLFSSLYMLWYIRCSVTHHSVHTVVHTRKCFVHHFGSYTPSSGISVWSVSGHEPGLG